MMTPDTLAQHLAKLRIATVKDLDGMLLDFLVRCYPNSHNQDN